MKIGLHVLENSNRGDRLCRRESAPLSLSCSRRTAVDSFAFFPPPKEQHTLTRGYLGPEDVKFLKKEKRVTG